MLKEGKGFQKFKHDFLLKANMLDISDHFVGQRVRAVSVGDPLEQKAVLLREGFSPEEKEVLTKRGISQTQHFRARRTEQS